MSAHLIVLGVVVAIISGCVADWPPHAGCKYNVTSDLDPFGPTKTTGVWYVDSIDFGKSFISGLKCFKFDVKFNLNENDVGNITYDDVVATNNVRVRVVCKGPNYADSKTDFNSICRFSNGSPFTQQVRFAATDYDNYALIYLCLGSETHSRDRVAFFSRNKNGLDTATRDMLKKKMSNFGWDPSTILRVPSQNGC